MAKKNKNDDVILNNIETENNISTEKSSKIGYRIVLKTKLFIIIDKYGINVRIKLPIQELVKYKVGDMYYL